MGHEGVRLDLKGQYGPLARWRINLRENYPYLMLLHNTDVFKDSPEIEDWTDSRFIEERASKGIRQHQSNPGGSL